MCALILCDKKHPQEGGNCRQLWSWAWGVDILLREGQLCAWAERQGRMSCSVNNIRTHYFVKGPCVIQGLFTRRLMDQRRRNIANASGDLWEGCKRVYCCGGWRNKRNKTVVLWRSLTCISAPLMSIWFHKITDKWTVDFWWKMLRSELLGTWYACKQIKASFFQGNLIIMNDFCKHGTVSVLLDTPLVLLANQKAELQAWRYFPYPRNLQ